MKNRSFTQKLHTTIISLLLCLSMLIWSPKSYALTGEIFCTIPEHTHSIDCYELIPTYGMDPDIPMCGYDDPRYWDDAEQTEPHHHTEDCYSLKRVLICDNTDPSHMHSFDCYRLFLVLTCEKLENNHVHSDMCYPRAYDPNLDIDPNDNVYYSTLRIVCGKDEHHHTNACRCAQRTGIEYQAQWEASLPETLTGSWPDDIVSVAYSQNGYNAEYFSSISLADCTPYNDGITENSIYKDDVLYYTRYGDWYGYPFGQWCVMFAAFCAYYSGIPKEAFPYESGCETLVQKFIDMGVFECNGYTPQRGDLAFMSYDYGRTPTHLGIVVDYADAGNGEPACMTTIEGNNNSIVCERVRSLRDNTVFGYMNMHKLMERWISLRSVTVRCGGASVRLVFDSAETLESFGSLHAVEIQPENSSYNDLMSLIPEWDAAGTDYKLFLIEEQFEGPSMSLPDFEELQICSGGDDLMVGSFRNNNRLYVYFFR